MSNRKRPERKSSSGGLKEEEKKIFDAIRGKKGMGATKFELKGETSILPTIITRSITSLKKSGRIKELRNKGINHFYAVEFEPFKEIRGGDWYTTEGTLDVSKIQDLKLKCMMILEKLKDRVVTLEIMCKYFLDQESLSREQTKEILNNLVLDNAIMELKSTGRNEFSATRIGEVCYKLTAKKSCNGEAKTGAFASVPCGGCRHIGICSPDGVISPKTCVYFQKWLDF